MTAMVMTACTGQKAEKVEATQDNFNYVVDQFADLQILRYRVPGFESLSLKQKQLLYHLSEAALMDTTPLDGQSTVSFDAPSDVHPVTVNAESGNGLYASDSRFTSSLDPALTFTVFALMRAKGLLEAVTRTVTPALTVPFEY